VTGAAFSPDGQILYSAQSLDNLTFSAMLSGGWTSNEFGVGAQSFDFEDVPIEWRVESTYRPIDWLAARVGVDWSVTPRSLEVTAPRPHHVAATRCAALRWRRLARVVARSSPCDECTDPEFTIGTDTSERWCAQSGIQRQSRCA
jgi:hypothetical protein